jgi:hypothetical protein
MKGEGMDILKVLATKNSGLGETVVSSIFNYLLDPCADHGFGGAFLARYLSALSGSLGFLDEELLKRLRDCALADDPEVLVTPEWTYADSAADAAAAAKGTGRRIDSALRIAWGKKLYLIATELKIYARSSSDDSQLEAYVKMLRDERRSYLEDPGEGRSYEASDIECALIYLIPGDSKRGLEYARKATKACLEEPRIHGVVVAPWARSKLVESYEGPRASKPMERIFYELLRDDYYGEASPADQEAAVIVRSLRNAARKNFDYAYLAPPSRSGQFPDDATYRDGLLEDHRSLLESFAGAAKEVLGAKRLVANPFHTSIGVPLRAEPERGRNNALCRILTVDSYRTGAPLGGFVLELGRKHYQDTRAAVEAAVDAFPIRAKLVEARDGGAPLYHESGKENEPVFRILFEPEEGAVKARRDPVTKGFAALIRALKDAYRD